MSDYGALSLLPTTLVVALALWSHRTIESLLAGSILGLLIIAPGAPLALMSELALEVMVNETVAWIILVCGLMGSLIALFLRTGAVQAFTQTVVERAASRKASLMVTWVLGLALFVDDYLNSITVGTAMRQVTDRFRVSREMLAYVVDSTAAPVSVIIPISTWAVFFGALLVDNGVAMPGEGVKTYIQAIPYMFYAWFAVALVPLVISGVIPVLGPMRSAEQRAGQGLTIPPGAEQIEAANLAIAPTDNALGQARHFIIPLVLLAAATWWFDYDFLAGIFLTLAVYLPWVVLSRRLNVEETTQAMLDGFKSMIPPLAVLVCAFLLNAVNQRLGLTEFVISAIGPHVSANMLPVVVFLSMGLLSFATGSNWGVFVIVLPIVVSLTESLGADMTLMIGATLSASTFGSHACFYTDATVLTAQACGTTPYQHAITQLPFALCAATAAALAYLLIG